MYKLSDYCDNCPSYRPETLDGALGINQAPKGILVPPMINHNARFIIVGEAPGRNEAERGEPFIGDSGKLLDSVLMMAGLDRREAHITNTSLCWFGGAKVFTDACKARLREELNQHTAKFVLLLGNEALEAVLGVHGITEQSGFFHELGGKVYLPTFHPAAALRKDEYIHTMVLHAQKFARALADGKVDTTPVEVDVAKDKDDVERIVYHLKHSKEFTFDLETSQISFMGGQILCASFATDDRKGYVIPIYKNGSTFILDIYTLRAYLQELFSSPANKIAQNAKFDLKWLKKFGVEVSNVTWDTMLAQHLLNENLSPSLNSLITYYTDLPKYDEEMREHLPNKATSFSKVPPQILWKYAAHDAVATFRAYQAQVPLIEKGGYGYLFNTVTLPLMKALVDIEYRGVKVSRKKLTQTSFEVNNEIQTHEAKLYRAVGKQFNYNSTKQLSDILFIQRGLRSNKTTAAGKMSTDKEVLEKLAKKDVVAKEVLELRKLKKLSSTYLDGGKDGGLGRHLDSNDRLHCTFKVHGTHTGRLSSTEPNLQNIPRGPIRQMFIADAQYKLIEADYSQAEIRMAAVLSGCAKLKDVFDRGEDIHSTVAAQLMGKHVDDVSKDERGFAKFVVFGLVYGRGASSIAAQYNMPIHKAEDFLTNFFDLYPRLYTWRQEVVEAAMKTRELRNPYGRVRHFPPFGKFADIWERMAFNYPLQSTVADTCSRAIGLMHNAFKMLNLDAHIVLTVHDSIVVECREDLVPQVIGIMKKTMELPVPQINYSLPIDVSVSDAWGA